MKAKERKTSARKTVSRKATTKTTKVKISKGPVDLTATIRNKSEELLARLGFDCQIEISLTEDNRYLVKIQTNEPNLLIGYHGQTLSALQLIINLAVQKETSVWTPIVLDIGDYRERREEQLRQLALNIAQRVRFSGQPQSLTRLSAAERRIIHLALADDEMVETLSEGEGSDRHLVIRPKTNN